MEHNAVSMNTDVGRKNILEKNTYALKKEEKNVIHLSLGIIIVARYLRTWKVHIFFCTILFDLIDSVEGEYAKKAREFCLAAFFH